MTSIGFGLNIPSKSKIHNAPAGPPTRKPIARKPPPGFFGASANDDDAGDKSSDQDEGIFAQGPKFKKLSKRDTTKPPIRPPTSLKSSVNADLATHTAHSTLQTTAAEAAAAAEDPTIYAYDSLYDSMKSATFTSSHAHNTASLNDPSTRQPKYMTSLLAAAETRKRDLLRAKERMLQKEREAEGEEFKDKESFVTGAYKEQQEEMRRLEEEEAKREEEERKKSKGLSGLYRGLLERGERAHERAVEAAKQAAVGGGGGGEGEREEKKEEKKPLPAHVEVNDEGVVVDKRQLLSGGLNLLSLPSATKKPTSMQQSSSTSANSSARGYQGKTKIEMDRRARQTRMLEEQLAATHKRAREEEEAKAKELIERQVKREKTEGEVMGAKERYLARKKAKEEEERRAKEGTGRV